MLKAFHHLICAASKPQLSSVLLMGFGSGATNTFGSAGSIEPILNHLLADTKSACSLSDCPTPPRNRQCHLFRNEEATGKPVGFVLDVLIPYTTA